MRTRKQSISCKRGGAAWSDSFPLDRFLLGAALLFGILLGCGGWIHTEPVEQESIQLAKEFILEELVHVQTSYARATRSFRRDQLVLLVEVLETGNVFRGSGRASTTHPAARAYLQQQAGILRQIIRDPAAALILLKKTAPKGGKDHTSFDRALEVYIRTLGGER